MIRKKSGTHASISTTHSTQQSLIHWYQAHHAVHESLGMVQTEESENEYVIDEQRYQPTCLPLIFNPYARCYYRVKRIRGYRHYVQNIFEESYRTIRWIDLPGGQHQVAIDRNYMMNYVWLMSFITHEIDTTNKESARSIRYRFEDVLFHAENLGLSVQQFFKPLRNIAQSHSVLEEIGELMQVKIPRLPVERKILTLPLKPDYTILPGNNIEDFSKLLTYVRKESRVWSKFRALSEADKVDIVSKGLMEITDNLKELKGLLKRPLKALNAASCNCCRLPAFPPTLLSHVYDLRKAVKKIVNKSRSIDKDDKTIVQALLSEVVSHYTYVMKYGEALVEEVWDIILMIRLSYNFIKESPHNNIMIASHEAVLISKMNERKRNKLLRPSHFTVDDFFLAECPDTLRKLPIVIFSRNTELSLHLQGHKNSSKSKSQAPLKRFTMAGKRITKVGREKSEDEGEGTATDNQKGKLQFVSEGD